MNHSYDDDCLFCKIAQHQIPATVVYEDDDIIAFDDIAPQAPVHTLIVPKTHVCNMSDNPSDEIISKTFGAVGKIARMKGVDKSGYRIIQNNGKAAGQTVDHLHVHILGGTQFSEGMV